MVYSHNLILHATHYEVHEIHCITEFGDLYGAKKEEIMDEIFMGFFIIIMYMDELLPWMEKLVDF